MAAMECKAINPDGCHVFEPWWDIDDEDNNGSPCGLPPSHPIHDMQIRDQEVTS